MNIKDFASEIMVLAPKIVKGLVHYEHNCLSRGELNLPQFWALDLLYQNGTGKMSELAQYLGISGAAATGLIDRLIALELVNRRGDAHDRRIVLIELTAKGRHYIESIREQKIRTLIKAFDQISPDNRIQYLNALRQIVGMINVLPTEHPEKKTLTQ